MDPHDERNLRLARESAKKAVEYRATTPKWRGDDKTIDAIAKRVEETSERLRRISPGQQAAMNDIPWVLAKGVRNVLAHDYPRVDLNVLEGIVQNDLPTLIAAIDRALP